MASTANHANRSQKKNRTVKATEGGRKRNARKKQEERDVKPNENVARSEIKRKGRVATYRWLKA
ncbi:hypothetical protein AG1IA_02589 [Rhizoctonia solani AG-1 IA]|uniref:Uncharacterized protein n=1 Tax=Thanatephorus cucumeris (strain AG1-IA) TaxID=983506 RepID=L8WZH8_THACA|nr:hypothetical protein AG1IA_02589 [Rhizoctonia solani AG-1 IA]